MRRYAIVLWMMVHAQGPEMAELALELHFVKRGEWVVTVVNRLYYLLSGQISFPRTKLKSDRAKL
jgi:hypothetical protein